MTHLYDWAWAQIPSAAAAAVPGCVGVMRYVNGTKALTPVERDNHHAAGLGIGLIYEAAADDLEHPERAAGIAQRANELADGLGAPTNVPVFYCHDANDGQSRTVAASYQTLHAVSARPAGLYGTVSDLEGAMPAYGWQVETWLDGRPKGYVSPQAHLVQLANTKQPVIPGIPVDQYDTNILHQPFPLWGGTAPTPAQVPKGTGGMYFGYLTATDGKVHAYAIDGDVLVTELGGAPGAFGFPADALKYHSEQGIPLFPIDQATVDRVTAKQKGSVSGQGGGIDSAQLVGEILAALKARL